MTLRLILGVQSRHVMERIQSESLRLLCPELTDPLKGFLEEAERTSGSECAA